MAFETLGINLVIRGTKDMINSIENLSHSLGRYNTAVKQVQKQTVKITTSNLTTALKLYNQAVHELDDIQHELTEATQKMQEATFGTQEYADAVAEVNLLTQEETDKIAQINYQVRVYGEAARSAMLAHKEFGFTGETLSGIFKVLSGRFSETVSKLLPMTSQLSTLGVKGAAVGIVMDTLAIGFRAIVAVGRVVVGVLGNIINVIGQGIKKVFEFGWNLTKFVAKGLLNIAAAPFKFIASGFTSIWESIKRILEISIGMGLENVLFSLASKLRALGEQAYEAAADFQLLQVRLTGLLQRDMAEQGIGQFAENFDKAKVAAKDMSYWISKLAVKSIFSAEAISNTLTLAMAYDFTADEAKDLTVDMVNFATGMGLTDDAMRKIIENFGQMRGQGKMTGTELRDLARGAFLPVLAIFREMASLPEAQPFIKQLGLENTPENLDKIAVGLKKLGSTGAIDVDLFFKSFQQFSKKNFGQAMETASTTMSVVTSNVHDFLNTVIGWRVITPILDTVSIKMANFLAKIMTPATMLKFEKLGMTIASVVERIGNIFDKLVPIDAPSILDDLLESVINFFDYWDQKLLFANDLKSFLSAILPNADMADSLYNNLLKPIINIVEGDEGVIVKIRKIAEVLWQFVRDEVWPTLQTKWGEVWDGLKKKFDETMSTVVTYITDKVLGGLDSLKTWSEENATFLTPTIDALRNLVLVLAGKADGTTTEALEALGTALWNLAVVGLTKLGDVAAEKVTSIDAVREAIAKFNEIRFSEDTLKSLVALQSIFDFLKGAWTFAGNMGKALSNITLGIIEFLAKLSTMGLRSTFALLWEVFFPKTKKAGEGLSVGEILVNVSKFLLDASIWLRSGLSAINSAMETPMFTQIGTLRKKIDDAIRELDRLIELRNKVNDNTGGGGGNNGGGGGGDGGACFVPETIVLTDKGLFEIQFIKPGHVVVAYDMDTNSFIESPVIDHIISTRSDLVTVKTSFGEFHCSPNHRWLVNNEWIWALDLKPGMIIKTCVDTSEVISVTPYPGTYEVHNLTVDKFHTYLVDFQVVHNAKNLARGGVAPSGNLSWVGESGKELMMPIVNSLVLPNWSTTKVLDAIRTGSIGSRSTTTNITNNYNLGVNSTQVSMGIMNDFELMKLGAR